MLINRHTAKPVRVLGTATTERFEAPSDEDAMSLLGNTLALYEDGTFEGTLPQLGAVAGRIDQVLPAAEIVRRTVQEVDDVLRALADRYLAAP